MKGRSERRARVCLTPEQRREKRSEKTIEVTVFRVGRIVESFDTTNVSTARAKRQLVFSQICARRRRGGPRAPTTRGASGRREKRG